MDVFIDYAYREEELRVLPVAELARFVIGHEGKPDNSEVSISFVDDAEMTRLNGEYRGKAGPTDVLSFECDNLDDDFAAAPEGVEDVYELGDIVIAPDVAERQTAEFGTSLEGELSLLLTHGLLHLCGYDHLDDDEADAMEARERELLTAWADAGHEACRHVRDEV